MKRIFVLVLVFFLAAGFARAGELVFPFDHEAELLKFSPAQTAHCGTLSKWLLIDDPSASGGKALLVRPNPKTNYGSCFNVLLAKGVKAKDLRLKVMVKAVKGREDQGGGPLWRAKDENNYYVVRWNPLEDNFRLYYVKDGRRRMLASASLKAKAHEWHEIVVEHQGSLIKCYFDGKLLLKKKDRTFSAAGTIGLWSKADAETAFDSLSLEIINP